jgi:predicted MFS family arabinose efflux permease
MSALRYPLLLLAAGGFVSGASIRLAEPLLPKVAAEMDSGVAEASVLITAFTLAYGLFQLVHGALGDRVGKLRAVSGALCLAAVASALCATADSLASLALYRFLTGMTAGAVIPLSFAFVGDNVPFSDRQPVLGRFISGTLLGAAVGPLVGGVFSDHLGWRASFVAPALAFALIGLALIPVARREPVPSAPQHGVIARYAGVLRARRSRVVCLAVAIEGCLFYGAFGFLGAFLRLEYGLSYTAIGLVLAGFGIGGLAYSLTVPVLVARLGPRRMVMLGGWLLLVGFALLATSPWWDTATVLVPVLGFAFYLLHNTLQTQATEMMPAARGSAIAAFAFCLFAGQAAGVAIDGLLVESVGFRPMLAATGVGLAALAWWFARRLEGL